MNTNLSSLPIYLRNRFLFRFFLFLKLPAAWFIGARLHHLDTTDCTIRLPLTYFSKNPFRSVYFAAQLAAAELSTGLLVLLHIGDVSKVSMLVTEVKGNFYKKAGTNLRFECHEGEKIANFIQKAKSTGEGQEFSVTSHCFDKNDVEVSSFVVTWSIKSRKS